MTAYSPRHAFGVARDLPELRPEPPPSFFRRLVAAWRRKPAAPEVPSTPSGAAAAADTGQFAAIHPGPHLPPERPTVLARPDGVIVIDEKHSIDVQPVRPVYGQAPVAEVIAAEDAAMAAEVSRAAYARAQMAGAMCTRDPYVLRQVLNGLRNLPAPTTAGPELAERFLA